MSKNAKILATAAALTIGTVITTPIVQSKNVTQNNTNINNKNNIKEIKIVSNYATTQSSLLPNSIIYTNSTYSYNCAGMNDSLLAGQISFDKDNMKIKVKDWGTEYELDGFNNGKSLPFAKFTLFNSNLQSKYSLQTYQNQLCTVINELNNKSFNYNDIISVNIQDDNSVIYAGIANNTQLVNNNNNISMTSQFSKNKQIYIKISPEGLILMNGLYTAPDGNKYYFQNGQMVTNSWENVNLEGNSVLGTPNGTTINAYYFGANGIAEKGFQTINGKIQYLNPTTGEMELNKFITVDGKKYYLQPVSGIVATGFQTVNGNKYYFNSKTGIMETGWQTIDKNKYYFNPQTGVMETGWQTIDGEKYYFNSNGVMQTGFQKIDGSVYDFDNNGKLIDKVTIAIDGATNKNISIGSQFNPLEGVTLNDIADPTAKIEVSGTVNTNIPGVYKLTYTVTDSYGQTATVTREITVTSSKTSNTEDLYWSQGNLVINGNVNNKTIFPQSFNKKLVIMNADNKIVDSINTVSVNWYSNNKDNYSGFQGIITPNVLSSLKSNETYKFYVEINGQYIPLTSDIVSPYNNNYLLNVNTNKQLTIKKIDNTIKPINTGIASYEVGYFINNGYVINGDLSLNNTVFSKTVPKLLLVKDAQGNVVDTINCASMNWYSINKNNYSGFQGIIPNSVLDKLGVGESYTLSLETIVDGKTYETPINNTKGFILNDSIKYNILTNSENNITITRAQTYPVVNSGTGVFEDGYWMPYGYVMNIKADIGKEIPKGTKMQLISKNLEGQVVSVTTGVDVNWYSNNKNNYNGLQAIITPKQLVMASTSNKLYIRVNIDGKTYESPVTGSLDIYGSGSLNYGFKTIDNQINLIINN